MALMTVNEGSADFWSKNRMGDRAHTAGWRGWDQDWTAEQRNATTGPSPPTPGPSRGRCGGAGV
jgi:hypothetical protein